MGDICSFVTQISAEFNTQCLDTTTVAQTSYDMHLQRYSTTYVKYHEAQTYQRFNLDLEKSEFDSEKHDVILVPVLSLWLDGLKKYD